MFNSLLAEYKTPFGAVAAGEEEREEMTLRFTLPQGDPRTPSLLLYRAGAAAAPAGIPLCAGRVTPLPGGTPRRSRGFIIMASAFQMAPCCTARPMAAPITARGSCGSLPSTIRPTIFRCGNSPGR